MEASTISAIAREVKGAQDACTQLQPFTSRHQGFDLDAAYEAAHLLHAARIAEGAKPVGRKIGFTNPAIWPVYGVAAPIWGYVYEHTLIRADAGGRAECRLAPLADPKIEPEIVFRFKAAPRDGMTPEEILATIEWVACGFEVVQSHFPGWKFKPPDTVADGGLHGRLLVGTPCAIERLGGSAVPDLEALTLHLSKDGALVENGRGSNVLGSPLNALAHLIALLESQGGHARVQAGEIVATGTVTAAHAVRAGEKWTASVEGVPLDAVSLRFAP